jgi:dipeptidyl-peptidase-4
LTVVPGVHRILSSKAGGYLLDTHSSLKNPPRLDLLNGNGELLRTIHDRATHELESCHLGEVESFRISTADGLPLPVVWYLPPGFDRTCRYPVVIKVYGAPGSRNVRNRFDSRLSQYYLSQQGIISMRIDHRGSGHFGKAYTDLMHRNLGYWEIHDLIEIGKYLRTLPFINSEKIGIWGGSYGGYVASLALCRAPDYFSHGIADSSVIDWKWYDSAYTERYMDTPEQNPDGYRKSSVLTHIAGYRGGLRITHGSMDDNVHMQHTFQFLRAAAESGKTVELMIYPGERHGYERAAGVTEKRAAMAFWLKHFLGKEAVE